MKPKGKPAVHGGLPGESSVEVRRPESATPEAQDQAGIFRCALCGKTFSPEAQGGTLDPRGRWMRRPVCRRCADAPDRTQTDPVRQARILAGKEVAR